MGLGTFKEAEYTGTEFARMITSTVTLIRRPDHMKCCWECLDHDGNVWFIPDNLLRPVDRPYPRRRFIRNCRSGAEAIRLCPWASIVFSHDGGQWCLADKDIGLLLADRLQSK
jgi:hypothetical protein